MRPIVGANVEWCKKNGDNIFDLEYLPLDEVIDEINAKLNKVDTN